jgi:hypothetical protein
LRKYVDQTTIDRTVARHYSITEEALLLHTKKSVLRCITKAPIFLEGAAVQQEVYALPSREFTFLVLGLNTVLAPTQLGSCLFFPLKAEVYRP